MKQAHKLLIRKHGGKKNGEAPSVQILQSPVSTSSEIIQGMPELEGQGNLSSQNNDQSAAAGVQTHAMQQNETNLNAWRIAGAVVEKGLKGLQAFGNLAPVAPGLGPALGVVCGCIAVYYVSNLSISTHQQ